jgi:hypothetical protein
MARTLMHRLGSRLRWVFWQKDLDELMGENRPSRAQMGKLLGRLVSGEVLAEYGARLTCRRATKGRGGWANRYVLERLERWPEPEYRAA